MSAVRQIRKLEGLSEARVVNGIEIEQGIDIPPNARRLRYNQLRAILRDLQPGESFVHLSHGRAAARTMPERKFTARKLSNGKWRIWRVK